MRYNIFDFEVVLNILEDHVLLHQISNTHKYHLMVYDHEDFCIVSIIDNNTEEKYVSKRSHKLVGRWKKENAIIQVLEDEEAYIMLKELPEQNND